MYFLENNAIGSLLKYSRSPSLRSAYDLLGKSYAARDQQKM